MFKFKFIKGQKHTTNDLLIDLIHPSYPCFKENHDDPETQDTMTLVIMDEKEQATVGGIHLTKREIEHLQEDVRWLIPTGTFDTPYVWEGSNICFAYSQNLSFQASSPENLFRDFYHRLYEGLVEFGKQKKVGFVVVKLTSEAYSPTKEFGLWPYIIQLLPKAFSDGFFYGILPLRGCFYELYKKHLEKEFAFIDHSLREP